MKFTYAAAPHHIIFGQGAVRQTAAEAARLGGQRPFLVSTAGQMPKAAALLFEIDFAGRFEGAAMHTPVDVSAHALARLESVGGDLIVSFGGGSATGLGKALAVRTGLPLIAIGTTYGGSEMTALLGETSDGVKATRRDPRALPAAAIYDVDLTLSLSPATSAASGINAIAHAVEASYASDGNPIVSAIAVDAIAALAGSLRRVVADPRDVAARSEALRGACEAGLCLNGVSMGLHHKLCHMLGGAFDLPHAETHAIVLAHAMAYNAPAVQPAYAAIGAALGGDAVQILDRLARDIAPMTSLAALGMPEEGIDRAVELVMSKPYPNPVPLDEARIRGLIRRAWAGEAPAAV
ncbi:maleylacetate reductase [Sphingopyxis sp.]|uniref:maleylacetate reductase n=1 Tax=Sphingopyxis sp. TaxID=1908224 RepID=UPI002D7889EF|nr:maleylacetate reductase [Sphingopyxis sp.]HET6526370.1 maleylacetate reductase [Sphingopyxis sp.]